jgi:Fic family protein
MENSLANKLKEEKQSRFQGGLYHKTQISFTYNSNRIEGSRISEEQTRYIFETRTIGFKDEEAVPVDDIIETTNHFVAFDYLLDSLHLTLSPEIIKTFHRILKSGTSDVLMSWFALGDWKKLPNEVGGEKTTKPENVENEINQLNEWYIHRENISFETIVEYHSRFEKIHPFQDGNGRVGRLVMFCECLKNNVVPFIIDETHKQFYYRGLKEFERMPEYLLDTCRSAQDTYQEWIDYFYPEK